MKHALHKDKQIRNFIWARFIYGFSNLDQSYMKIFKNHLGTSKYMNNITFFSVIYSFLQCLQIVFIAKFIIKKYFSKQSRGYLQGKKWSDNLLRM